MPLTKEQIFEKHMSVERRQTDSRMFGGYDFEYLNRHKAGDAMDEWLFQEMPRFITWAFENGWRLNPFDNTNYKWTNPEKHPPTVSTEELYKIFVHRNSTPQTEQ